MFFERLLNILEAHIGILLQLINFGDQMERTILIWLKNPKCAGTSFETALRELGCIYYVDQDTCLADLNNPLHKVICVRSGCGPNGKTWKKSSDGSYEIVYSSGIKSTLKRIFKQPFEPVKFMLANFPDFFHSHKKFAILRNPFDKFVSSWKFLESTRNMDIKDLLEHLPDKIAFMDWLHITKTQHDCLFDHNGNSICDYYVYMELDLNEQLNKMLLYAGIDEIKLPHKRKSARSHCAEHLEESSIAAILQIYRQDFDDFGYSPNIETLAPELPNHQLQIT